MSIEKPKYDAAISFLSKDEKTARAIYDKLSENFEVFFFPRNQEDLAGTDGLESMRTPFLDCRVIVVLYREDWGKTKWTGVEATAIKDACLNHQFKNLFFVMLDVTSKSPSWLPETHVWLNLENYGVEQAVGAIKARIQERGGELAPLTPLKLAEKLKADEAFRADKVRMMSSETGVEKVFTSVCTLLEQIQLHCERLIEEQRLPIQHGVDSPPRAKPSCVITNGSVGLYVLWEQRYRNMLEGSLLFVREYNGGLIVPGTVSGSISYFGKPELLRETQYVPELSFAREYGWKQRDGKDFLTSSALAEKCVMQFLALYGRSSRGELKRDFP